SLAEGSGRKRRPEPLHSLTAASGQRPAASADRAARKPNLRPPLRSDHGQAGIILINMSQASDIAISLKGVTVRLGGRAILEDFELDVPAGQVTAVMGPSGAGKTTVLRLITGQLKPDAGEVWIGQTRVDRLGSKALGRVRRNIGVLLQNGALF